MSGINNQKGKAYKFKNVHNGHPIDTYTFHRNMPNA